jgi:hypothetical protein
LLVAGDKSAVTQVVPDGALGGTLKLIADFGDELR